MTSLTYCRGPLNTGCATNALVPHGRICPACESKSAEVAAERSREGERLRSAGFSLVTEINSRPLWSHPNHEGHVWHEQALASVGEPLP